MRKLLFIILILLTAGVGFGQKVGLRTVVEVTNTSDYITSTFLAPGFNSHFSSLGFKYNRYTEGWFKSINADSVITLNFTPLGYLNSNIGFSTLPFQYGYIDTLNVLSLFADTLTVGRIPNFETDYIQPDVYAGSSLGLVGNPFNYAYVDYVAGIAVTYDTVHVKKFPDWNMVEVSKLLPNQSSVTKIGTRYGPFDEIHGRDVFVDDLTSNSISTPFLALDSLTFTSQMHTDNNKFIVDSSGLIFQHTDFGTVGDTDTLFRTGSLFDPVRAVLLFGGDTTQLMPYNKAPYLLRPGRATDDRRWDHDLIDNSSKKGGVFFRCDDHGHRYTMLNYLWLFNKYGYKLTWSYNWSNAWVNVSRHTIFDLVVKMVVLSGANLDDHTTDHNPRYSDLPEGQTLFTLASAGVDTIFYDVVDGVDNGVEKVVFEEWAAVAKNPNIASPGVTSNNGNAYAKVRNGHMLISYDNGAFLALGTTGGKLWLGDPSDPATTAHYSSNNNDADGHIWISNPADPDTFFIYDQHSVSVGLDTVGYYSTLPDMDSVYYEIRDSRTQTFATQDGARAMLQASNFYFRKKGFPQPVIFIQTGDAGPGIAPDTLRRVGPLEGLIGGRGYGTNVAKTYGIKRVDAAFAFEWGDFDVEQTTAQEAINVITDLYAKHRVAGGGAHLGTADAAYFAKVDSVMMFCKQNQIPVLAMDEWVQNLFHSSADVTENVFPRTDVDLNQDGVPDGYFFEGSTTWDETEGVPEGGNKSIATTATGDMFQIIDGGGVELGENSFVFWAKGATSVLEVILSGDGWSETFLFSISDASNYQKFKLTDSTNGNTVLICDDNLGYTDININVSSITSTLNLSGFDLYKKRD